MLLLVTIGLVLVGAVSLVIGFVSNSLGPIYLSIACSVIAGIVLVVFSRMSRRQEATAAAPASTPGPARGSWAPSSPSGTAAQAPASDRAPAQPEPAAPSSPAPPAPSYRPEPRRTITRPQAAGATLDEPVPAPLGDDFDFPIEGYDNMRASQILERLDELDLDELDMVREREEQGKNRATIIRRVDALIDQLEAGEEADAIVAQPAAGPSPVFEAPAAEPQDKAVPASPAGAGADGDFPIEDYDELSVEEIISMLDDLDDDELDMVAEREEQGSNRVEILDYIDGMFEEVDDGEPAAPIVTPPPPPPAPPAAEAPARKAAATKAPAAKAPARRAAAAKAPARRAAATKAPAAKAPARKATPVAKAGAGSKAVAKAAGRPPTAKKATAAPVPAKAPGRKAASATKAAKASPGTRTAAKTAAATKVPVKKAGAAKKR